MQPAQTVQSKLEQVQEQIQRAARRAGRDPSGVRLVVVTKTHPPDVIQQVLAAGALHLGESYVDEAVPKITALADHPQVQWHMIGHVQSRKASAVSAHFNYVHSLDSLKLANRLDRFCAEQGRRLSVLLECNVSGEESKYGWPAWDEDRWEELFPAVAAITSLPHLDVCGLMTMAPFTDDPEQARPHFQKLRRLQAVLVQQFPQANWSELSMGMSADFAVAVEEGATWVRIGTAILGQNL